MYGREHELKTWPEPFVAMLDGRKTFEFRKDDRAFMVGDLVTCREWDPGRSQPFRYTGQWLRVRVTYVLHGGRFGVPEGYVVLGTRLISSGDSLSKEPPRTTEEERAT